MTLTPEEHTLLLEAYTAYLLDEEEHLTINTWAKKQLIDKIQEISI